MKRLLKRRQMVEPMIGHMKSDDLLNPWRTCGCFCAPIAWLVFAANIPPPRSIHRAGLRSRENELFRADY